MPGKARKQAEFAARAKRKLFESHAPAKSTARANPSVGGTDASSERTMDMAANMRAKLKLHHIDRRDGSVQETLYFHAVSASRYPDDGSDENNTYSRYSPSATLQLTVANPALIGKFNEGEEYYVDFTPVG